SRAEETCTRAEVIGTRADIIRLRAEATGSDADIVCTAANFVRNRGEMTPPAAEATRTRANLICTRAKVIAPKRIRSWRGVPSTAVRLGSSRLIERECHEFGESNRVAYGLHRSRSRPARFLLKLRQDRGWCAPLRRDA